MTEGAYARHIAESLVGMEADWGDLDHQLLRHLSGRIINEVRGINRVVATSAPSPPQ